MGARASTLARVVLGFGRRPGGQRARRAWPGRVGPLGGRCGEDDAPRDDGLDLPVVPRFHFRRGRRGALREACPARERRCFRAGRGRARGE
eukprot:8710623-Alexandrium_andersonii.AAC.1